MAGFKSGADNRIQKFILLAVTCVMAFAIVHRTKDTRHDNNPAQEVQMAEGHTHNFILEQGHCTLSLSVFYGESTSVTEVFGRPVCCVSFRISAFLHQPECTGAFLRVHLSTTEAPMFNTVADLWAGSAIVETPEKAAQLPIDVKVGFQNLTGATVFLPIADDYVMNTEYLYTGHEGLYNRASARNFSPNFQTFGLKVSGKGPSCVGPALPCRYSNGPGFWARASESGIRSWVFSKCRRRVVDPLKALHRIRRIAFLGSSRERTAYYELLRILDLSSDKWKEFETMANRAPGKGWRTKLGNFFTSPLYKKGADDYVKIETGRDACVPVCLEATRHGVKLAYSQLPSVQESASNFELEKTIRDTLRHLGVCQNNVTGTLRPRDVILYNWDGGPVFPGREWYLSSGMYDVQRENDFKAYRTFPIIKGLCLDNGHQIVFSNMMSIHYTPSINPTSQIHNTFNANRIHVTNSDLYRRMDDSQRKRLIDIGHISAAFHPNTGGEPFAHYYSGEGPFGNEVSRVLAELFLNEVEYHP